MKREGIAMDLTKIRLENVLEKDKIRIEAILPIIPSRKIYSTIGVYADGSKIYNAVDSMNLKSHIEYNLVARFGRAFFLEGICLNPGYLDSEKISKLENEFEMNPRIPEEVIIPYR